MKNTNLQMVERLILESLSRSEKNLHDLFQDTSLSYGLLNNILSKLMFSEMIVYKSGKYSLHPEAPQKISLSSESLQAEIKELFVTLVNQHYDDKEKGVIKVQKVWMDESEEKIFQSYLINLEKFLEGLKTNSRKAKKAQSTKEQKVVVWGHSEYTNLVGQTLKAV